MKGHYWLVIAVVFLLGAAAIFPAFNYIEKQRDIRSVDGLVYTFIVGKVEGNDDLLASILTEKAQGIIKPGRHAFPGDAEEMGERYYIYRFENEYENGTLFYRVEFYRPSTGKTDYYNVVVINNENGWEIAKNSSIDNHIMRQLIDKESGTEVHGWER